MKLGILTIHGGINHGSYLQAYCIQETCRSLGHDVRMINYRSRDLFWNEARHFLSFRPYVSWANTRRRALNVAKIVKFLRAHRKFALTRFSYDIEQIDTAQFDCTVFGSEEIWNVRNRYAGGGDLAYFGKGVHSPRRIAYAATCGNVAGADEISDEQAALIRQMDAVSVRDRNTRSLMDALDIDCVQVLDPTYLHTLESLPAPRERNYILIYLNSITDENADAVATLARRTGKKLVGLSYAKSFCDVNRVVVDPFEWAAYFKHADYVFTNAFHGAAYSIISNRNFCCLAPGKKSLKLLDQLESMGLSDRATDDAADVARLYDNPIDYDAVNSRWRRQREFSLDFLRSALAGPAAERTATG